MLLVFGNLMINYGNDCDLSIFYVSALLGQYFPVRGNLTTIWSDSAVLVLNAKQKMLPIS